MRSIPILTDDSFRILLIKESNPDMTVSEIADKTNIPVHVVNDHLQALCKAKFLTESGGMLRVVDGDVRPALGLQPAHQPGPLEYAIKQYTAKHGYSPTIRELAKMTGVGATTVHTHLKEMLRNGYLRVEQPRRRMLKVVRDYD